MKKEEVLCLLSKIIESTYQHEKFVKEIEKIIYGKSGAEGAIFQDIFTQLKMLDLLGPGINKYNSNEILKNANGIYSLHIQRKEYNIRLLLKFFYNGKVNIPCFLVAFEEDGTGRKDKSGYSSNIEVANKRFEEMTKWL